MNSVFRKSVGLLLALLIAISSFSGCSVNRLSVGKLKTNNKNIAVGIVSESSRKLTKNGFTRVAQSEGNELLYDSKTASVAVYDSAEDFYWTALPIFSGDMGAMLSATVLSEEGRYYLNSQDSSVAFSSFTCDYIDDGVKITYNMSDNASTAVKNRETLSEKELLVSIPVEIVLKDGNMKVAVINRDVFVSNGYVLDSVSVLPSFGALCYTDYAKQSEAEFYGKDIREEASSDTEENASDNEKKNISSENIAEDKQNNSADAATQKAKSYNDFMLLPDGCGAVLYTEPNESGNENLSFKLYSNDDLTDTVSARVPAFGVKKGNCAFVAVIGDNGENATVKANRAAVDSDSANRVYTEFKLFTTASCGTDTCYAPVSESISEICYRFLSGSQADYIGMAAACREYLICEGKLPTGLTRYDKLPLNIAVVCTVNGAYSTKVSDFEEAEDVLSVLKGKGINSVNMIIQGAFSGGMLQNSSDKLNPLKKSGGRQDFDSMCEYAHKQQFKVFAGLNMLSAASDSKTARKINGKKLTSDFVNPLAPFFGSKSYNVKILSADKIERNTVSLLNSAKNLNISGFCINDAAELSYADYSNGIKDASSVSSIVSENLSAFSVHKELMLDGCNFNMLKNASYLLNVPFGTQNSECDSYRAVPFVPAVLHGGIGYSGIAANTAALPKIEMLKTVEYGGIPYFMWTFDSDSHLYYQNSLAQTAEFALRVTEELSDLSDARITGHRVIQNGLFVTEYDTGSMVYVNYNNFSVPIDNITVPPYDYIRIN